MTMRVTSSQAAFFTSFLYGSRQGPTFLVEQPECPIKDASAMVESFTILRACRFREACKRECPCTVTRGDPRIPRRESSGQGPHGVRRALS
jgi:hypothetical protein